MKKSRFTRGQTVWVLRQACVGLPVKDICRQAGISAPTQYQLNSKYGRLEVSELRQFKELDAQNVRLKRMCAERLLDAAVMKDLILGPAHRCEAAPGRQPGEPGYRPSPT